MQLYRMVPPFGVRRLYAPRTSGVDSQVGMHLDCTELIPEA